MRAGRQKLHHRLQRWIGLLAMGCVAAQVGFAQPRSKPIKRPETLGLDDVLNETAPRTLPPDAVKAQTARLTFHVSPLSDKGLLSDQTRDALKALDKANRDGTIVQLRAFVAGNGDVRRVESIVIEMFEDKKWPLPAISAVQVGGLPLTGAQVVIEAISEDRKRTPNENGLVFVSAQEADSAEAAVGKLASVMKASGADAVRLTCFGDTLQHASAAQSAAHTSFPKAPGVFVQAMRYSIGAKVACEGIGRLAAAGPVVTQQGVTRWNPEGAETSDRSQAVLVRKPMLVFTRMQTSPLAQAADAELAQRRLNDALEAQGVGFADLVLAHVYAMTPEVADKIGEFRTGFLDPAIRPARTLQLVEGLPSYDAAMAVELIAAQ